MNELFRRMLFLPPQASTVAREIDLLHYFVISATMAGATFVAVLAVVLIIRFRQTAHRRADTEAEAKQMAQKPGVPFWGEAGIIAFLLTLFCAFWVVGFRQYVHLRTPPAESTYDVYVTGKKWMWSFAYPNGAGSNGVLTVPAERPVKLIMTSRDVIHSFYVPAFRIKQDVVPGRMTTVWFEAVAPGDYPIFCTEYCGAGHSTMRAVVRALSPEDFAGWEGQALTTSLAGPHYEEPHVVLRYPRKPISLATLGERVATEQGCLRCHTVDGTPHIGPTWRGAYGSVVTLVDGTQVWADEAYLTESMMDPLARIHRGYDPVMPAYHGLLTAAETGALVEYIKSLKDREDPATPDPLPSGPLRVHDPAQDAPRPTAAPDDVTEGSAP